jgi:hypothetical protein
MSGGRGGALGVTVKSGWACVVLVEGSSESPRVLETRTVDLADPATPESRQPYHDGFGTARSPGPALNRLVTAVERYGARSLNDLFDHYKTGGHSLCGVGVVVGSLIDPDSIGNSHVRIHALEGRLFREIVVEAAERRGIPCAIHRERDLYEHATVRLGKPGAELRRQVSAIERPVGGLWRAEQKAAALAAWMMLKRR